MNLRKSYNHVSTWDKKIDLEAKVTILDSKTKNISLIVLVSKLINYSKFLSKSISRTSIVL